MWSRSCTLCTCVAPSFCHPRWPRGGQSGDSKGTIWKSYTYLGASAPSARSLIMISRNYDARTDLRTVGYIHGAAHVLHQHANVTTIQNNAVSSNGLSLSSKVQPLCKIHFMFSPALSIDLPCQFHVSSDVYTAWTSKSDMMAKWFKHHRSKLLINLVLSLYNDLRAEAPQDRHAS